MCNCQHKGHCFLVSIIIVIALALALIVSIWHQPGLQYIIFTSRFFDVMIPVLGVGALLKYLLFGCRCSCKRDECCKNDQPK